MNRRPDRAPRQPRSIETTGKTVEDALRAAMQELGIPKEQIEIEIIDEGRGGFLGLGSRDARIRARARGAHVSQHRGSHGRSDEPRVRSDRAPAERQDRTETRAPRGEQDLRARVTGAPREDHRGRDNRGPGGRRRGGGRRQDGPRHEQREPVESRAEQPRATERPQAPRSQARPNLPAREEGAPVRASEPRTGGREAEFTAFTDGLLRRMEFAGSVATGFDGESYNVTIEGGEDDGLLIGRGGETLDAIQHILLKMAGRSEEGVQVKVDISGYRSRREDQLADKARDLARQVLDTGRGMTVGPYKAAERRIVHRAVAEIEGVTTRALGDGVMKRILIEATSSAAQSADSRGAGAAEPMNSRPERDAPRRRRDSGAGSYGQDVESAEPSRDESPGEGDTTARLSSRASAPPQAPAQEEWGRRPKIVRGMKNRR